MVHASNHACHTLARNRFVKQSFYVYTGRVVFCSVVKMESWVQQATIIICEIMAAEIVKKHIMKQEQRKIRKNRRWWTREWILNRRFTGASALIQNELSLKYSEDFKNLLRMSEDHFNYLLQRISPRIQKSDTHLREAIPAKTKLQVTLRYLATGDSFKSLEFLFKIPKTTTSKFLPDVLDNIYTCLQEYIEVPKTTEEWQKIESGFSTRWNFPNCIGAIDGKHIVIKSPPNSGSDYFNYKKDNSIILLALVDHDYCFTYIDVGAKGRASDGGVWQNSSLLSAFETRSLNIPLNGIIVGDDAFPLNTFLLKPYSRRNLTREEKILLTKLE